MKNAIFSAIYSMNQFSPVKITGKGIMKQAYISNFKKKMLRSARDILRRQLNIIWTYKIATSASGAGKQTDKLNRQTDNFVLVVEPLKEGGGSG